MYFEFFPRISILVVSICGVLVNNASSIDVGELRTDWLFLIFSNLHQLGNGSLFL